MATYKAIANGNSQDLAIWQVWTGSAWVAASVLPSTADDVYSNNFTVTITDSVSYLSFNNFSVDAPLSIARGGMFLITGTNEITTQGFVKGIEFLGAGSSACIRRAANHTAKYIHIGNHSGGGGNFGYAIQLQSIADADIYGDSIGTQAGAIGLNINANCNVRVFGNQYGGTLANTIHTSGILINSASNVQIFGNQYGGISAQSYGVQITVAGVTCRISGVAEASMQAPAVHNSSPTSVVIYEGAAFNNLGIQAIVSPLLYFKVLPTSVWRYNDFDGNEQRLVSPQSVEGMPPANKVEAGYEYGVGLTGSLEVEQYLALPLALQSRLENVVTEEILVTQLGNLNF